MQEVVIDPDVYPRSSVSEATVTKYAALMSEGVEFPPIIVERGTGRLLDGMHRHRAYEHSGVAMPEPEAHDIPEGSTALAYAALLNQGHGLPMRESDLRDIALDLFSKGATVAEAARHIGVPRTTVNDWVAPLLERRRAEEQRLRDVRNIGFRLLAEAGWTQQRIADHHGVGQSTVAEIIGSDGFVAADNAALVWEAVATYSPIEPAVPGIADKWLNPSKPHVSNNSGENEWYTPPEFIRAAHAVYEAYQGTCGDCDPGCSGEGCSALDLDPASSEVANLTVYAKRFYTAEDDGLTQEWANTVWLNPPYANPLIGDFVDKLLREMDAGRTSVAIVLVNNATETKWAQRLLKRATAVCFPSGRIKYLDHTGTPANTPLQGQMLVYLISQNLRAELGLEGTPPAGVFAANFGQFGAVLDGAV